MSPRLSHEQIEERRLGMSATDVSTAAGVNPYMTPFELYLEKIGELDTSATISDASRGRMERGHRLEDVALEWDRDITGESFVRVNRTIWHKTIPILFCHPDAARDRKLTHLIEVKTTTRSWKDVPRHVEAQVQMQMACTGASRVTILVQTFDGPPTRLEVQRDPDLIDALERLAVAFWDKVQRREPPALDGSDGAGRWLDRTAWNKEPPKIADAGQTDLLARLVRIRARVEELQHADDLIVQQIKLSMGGSGRLNAPGIATALWTAPYNSPKTKWKEVATEYRATIERLLDAWEPSQTDPEQALVERIQPADLDAIVAAHTTVREQTSFTVQPIEPREETNE